MKTRGIKRAQRFAELAAGDRASFGSDPLILTVGNEGSLFAPAATEDWLDLTRATSESGWRCGWVECGCDHA